MIAGFYGDKYIFKLFNPEDLEKDDIIRRNNIIYNQNPGYMNQSNFGSKNAIMGLIGYTYISLFFRSSLTAHGRKYYLYFLLLPLIFTNDFIKYYYP